VTAPAFEVVLHDGPLPALSDDPLTEREMKFRALIAGVVVNDRVEVDPRYTKLAAQGRAAWHKRTGVPVRKPGEWRA